ncbi:amino acid permease [Solirubrobacter sp. CPCC 204708]|uniref:Amino acid permease n=1 Tax=Solirubrobacter deserti TaxID=2282478 RepID=A0ABT4RRG5_9ACTN|nr:amino acid permease [Solirubrobacter deserti]MBE2314782.1 amino acid permease [Solirubrobacter deserti]MDA0141192.1 amino acid permease [Solirubrobacter deserti]
MGASRSTTGPFAVKDHSRLIADTEAGAEEGGLKRAVGALDLTALGIGAVIGTGIFVVIGEGIGLAGPAVILSFVLAAVTCVFSALCYAELASSIPVSGSAYTYAYATLGELVAWIIGWDLILEYGVAVAAVAVGWGGNLNEFLDNTFGFALPESIANPPEEGGTVNLPAVVIVACVTFLLVRGVRETAKANFFMVIFKLLILAFFIVVAFATAFSADNLSPFAPEGVNGVVSAAAVIFFAYIGFDAVSTGAEEARQPRRDLPIAIIGSLIICTIVYILVSIAAVGSLDAKALQESEAPLAAALDEGAGISWGASIVALGALVAITSVLLTIFYGQTRIFFAMARDGLMPRNIAKVNPRTGTPAKLTIGLGVFIAALAAFVPLSEIVQLVNIGTLFAFLLVNIGVVILRITHPDMERPFRVPLAWPVPIFPLIGVGLIIYLMQELPAATWWRFGIWLAIGIAFYFLYGRRHSVLQREHRS